LKGLLDVKLAKEIADAYGNDKGKSLIDGGMQDTKSVWFSLDDLKHYIWAIEDTLSKQGADPDKLNMGIRVYFAKYPDSSRIRDFGVDPSYASHHTVFFVATYKGEKSNVDFDPWNVGPDKSKPIPFAQTFRGTGLNRSSMFKGLYAGAGGFGDGDAGTVLNHGDLAPPPAGSGVFPQE
jgi:hypothetical protein